MCYTETKQPTMISLRHLHVNAPFRYLWLKYVSGVNLSVHCARCLLGEYDPRISARVKELHEQPLRPSPYYYLCGVSKPYVWSRNFHLAFREKEGSLLSGLQSGRHRPRRPARPLQGVLYLPQLAVCPPNQQAGVTPSAEHLGRGTF